MSYSIIEDSGRYLCIKNISGTNRMYCRKDLLRLHKYETGVDLIYTDNNLLVGTWDEEQAVAYGHTLDTLSDYILGLLNSGGNDYNGENYLLDENGDPILDENGDPIINEN